MQDHKLRDLQGVQMKPYRVLVVDDEQLICWSLSEALVNAGYSVETACSGAEAREKFHSFSPHIALLDVALPDVSGLELLEKFKQEDESLIAIMITANAHLDSTIRALKLGAEDYISKPFKLDKVEQTIADAVKKLRLNTTAETVRQNADRRVDCNQLIGNSPKMIEVFKMIKVCAETDCKTVLILGESGTGKDLAARALHQYSARADMPFIDVNCAAIPENLLENELFGHEKGAYTDASNRERGIFECAEGGTVFLDEIGDMPLTMQAKILKVIENKRYRRLGGKEDLEANVRIIAATNQNLPKLVSEGRFRGDLFFRLNVLTIHLPPLRERRETIPNMAAHFVDLMNIEYGKSIQGIAFDTLECLRQYEWPGNCRELRHAIERAVMLEQNKVLTLDHLPAEVTSSYVPKGKSVEHTPQQGSSKVILPPEGISIEQVEMELLQQALSRFGGNQTKAAQCLGITRDTLRYRMKKFNLEDGPKKALYTEQKEKAG